MSEQYEEGKATPITCKQCHAKIFDKYYMVAAEGPFCTMCRPAIEIPRPVAQSDLSAIVAQLKRIADSLEQMATRNTSFEAAHADCFVGAKEEKNEPKTT